MELLGDFATWTGAGFFTTCLGLLNAQPPKTNAAASKT